MYQCTNLIFAGLTQATDLCKFYITVMTAYLTSKHEAKPSNWQGASVTCSGVPNLGNDKSEQSEAEITSSNGWSLVGIALKYYFSRLSVAHKGVKDFEEINGLSGSQCSTAQELCSRMSLFSLVSKLVLLCSRHWNFFQWQGEELHKATQASLPYFRGSYYFQAQVLSYDFMLGKFMIFFCFSLWLIQWPN